MGASTVPASKHWMYFQLSIQLKLAEVIAIFILNLTKKDLSHVF